MSAYHDDHYSLISRQTPAGTEDRTEYLTWSAVKKGIKGVRDLFIDTVVVSELAISFLHNKQVHVYFAMNERTGLLVPMRDLGLRVNESET